MHLKKDNKMAKSKTKTFWMLFNSLNFYDSVSDVLWWALPVTFELGKWVFRVPPGGRSVKKCFAWKRQTSSWWKRQMFGPFNDSFSEFINDSFTEFNFENQWQAFSAQRALSELFDSPKGSKAEALMQLAVMHPEVDTVYEYSGSIRKMDEICFYQRINDFTSKYKKVKLR